VGDDKERRQKDFLPDFRGAIKAVDHQWNLGLSSSQD
jgi:hypothetical protein